MCSLEAGSAGQAPAEVFAALGDVTRLALVDRLGDGREHSIAQLTGGLGLTRQGVTKHLKVLEAAGLVRSRRAGRETRFQFQTGPVEEARSYLDSVSRQWDEALGRLKVFVEEDAVPRLEEPELG